MKKVLFLIIVMMSCSLVSQQLIGKVQHFSSTSELSIVEISERVIKEIKLDNEGTFSTENLKLSEGYYLFRSGNESITIYLKQNDVLVINFDAGELVNTVAFSGEGSKRNTYLISKRRYSDKFKEKTDVFYGVDVVQYKKNVMSLQKRYKELLTKEKLDKNFVYNEITNLKYDYLLDLFNYKNSQKVYFGKEIKMPSEFLALFEKTNLDNEKLYTIFPAYKNLASLKWKLDIENKEGFVKMDQVFSKVKTKPLSLELLFSFYYAITEKPEKAQDYYALFRKYVTSPNFIRRAKNQLNSVKATAKGKKSPSFNYKNTEGKQVALANFIGKYVFIDVWATWCMPCLQQIPYIEDLENKFKEKKIVFVSISVDDEDKIDFWKETVKTKAMKGVQLFADKSFDSDFIRSYGVASLPRFILIDPSGNIVNSNMYKPSDTKTAKILADLLQ